MHMLILIKYIKTKINNDEIIINTISLIIYGSYTYMVCATTKNSNSVFSWRAGV